MRITSANAFDTAVANLQKRQQGLEASQNQLTSGKKVQKASDDPSAAASAERALARIQRVESEQRALQASRSSMEMAEGALADAGEILQQAREVLVAAGNGSYGDNDRSTLADKLRGLRQDLLSVANRSDGAGRYLFGGQGSDSAPLVDAFGGVAFNGAGGQQQAAVGESTPLSIDGRHAFLQAPDPANPGGTRSIFDTLDRVIAELATPGRSSSAIATTVREGLRDVDAGAQHLSNWRAKAGEALNRIDNIDTRLAGSKLDAQTERSRAEDLDLVAAISDFQARQTGYDAALKAYSQVQKLSLFDYLR